MSNTAEAGNDKKSKKKGKKGKKTSKTEVLQTLVETLTAKEPNPAPPFGVKEGRLTLDYSIMHAIEIELNEYRTVKHRGPYDGGVRVGVADINDLSVNFIRAIIEDPRTPKDVRAHLKRYTSRTPQEILSTPVAGPHEFYAALRLLCDGDTPVMEFELCGQWYPVPLSIDFFGGIFFRECHLHLEARVGDQEHVADWYFTDAHFKDRNGVLISRTVLEVLADTGLRPTSPERVKEFQEKLLRASTISGKIGTMSDLRTSVLIPVDLGWRERLVKYALGSPTSPTQVVIEPELEAQGSHRTRGEKTYELPFVRVFSFKLKRYVYADVDTLVEHNYNRNARDLLVLPPKLKRALDAVIDIKPEDVFGDVFEGRHGGVVILATGDPGVGKTLTAETYAESMGRPLYPLEMGELGIDLASVEENLQKIFDRARRWNAILLLDEADIYLAKRQDAELEKGAIVSTFLRLLDYYEGFFFLTTNRENVIDDAFRSRITLRLSYPNLVLETRTKIWAQLFHKAGIEYSGNMEELAKEDLNGRNIRNAVRVLKMLNPGQTVAGMTEIREALEYISRPEKQ